MTDKQHAYDPDLPYVVEHVPTRQMVARFQADHWADELVASRRFPDEFKVIDTTPKPRVPDDAKFITWRDQGNDRWYAEREGDAWCTDDGELFGVVEDLPDVTPETVFTVLEERKS